MASKRRQQRPVKEGKGRTALITGASAGIGAALAREFAKAGYDVVLTARREARLNELAQTLSRKYRVRTRVHAADLADPTAPDTLFETLTREGVIVGALVNNAGYGLSETFAETRWIKQADFMQVLVSAPTHLTHLFLPDMLARGFGRILNVSSAAGLLPGAATSTLYAGAKSFLIKFSQSLHLEVEGTGVHVTALCPGFTYSEFHDVTGSREEMNRIPKILWQTADDVAREGYRAVERNRPVHVTGPATKVITGAAKVLPNAIAFGLARRHGKNRPE